MSDKNISKSSCVAFTNDRNAKPASALDLKAGYVQAAEGIYFDGDFTITAWVMLRKYSTWAAILDFGNGPRSNNIILSFCGLNKNVAFQIYYGSNQTLMNSKEILILNKWYFISAL